MTEASTAADHSPQRIVRPDFKNFFNSSLYIYIGRGPSDFVGVTATRSLVSQEIGDGNRFNGREIVSVSEARTGDLASEGELRETLKSETERKNCGFVRRASAAIRSQ